MQHNEESPHKTLPPRIRKPSQPHTPRSHRATHQQAAERDRTRRSPGKRTKHDQPQHQAPNRMQHPNQSPNGKKTHPNRKPGNHRTYIRSHRKPQPKILPLRRKMQGGIESETENRTDR